MKRGKLILIITIALIVGCNENVNKEDLNIESEINNLKTEQDKIKFLEAILEEDQKVRDGEKVAALMLKYGKDSKEYMEYINAQWKQDEINLQKIEIYLKTFGYPNKKSFGKDAAIAPWLVIHHSTDLGVRNRNFEYLYAAYLIEDIDDTAMSMYLGRTYEFTFRERLRMESPYKPEDEINQLIEKLNLEEKKAKVKAK